MKEIAIYLLTKLQFQLHTFIVDSSFQLTRIMRAYLAIKSFRDRVLFVAYLPLGHRVAIISADSIQLEIEYLSMS